MIWARGPRTAPTRSGPPAPGRDPRPRRAGRLQRRAGARGRRLHLIAFSDEPDQSVGSFSHYVSAYRALKDDPTRCVHAIGEDYPGLRRGQPLWRVRGHGGTGGHFWSIEARLGTILTDLTDAMSVAGGVFQLSSEPLPRPSRWR